MNRQLEMWIVDNLEDLQDQYIEHCQGLQDSMDHINYMLNSDRCFDEWCAERFVELFHE